MLLPSQTYIAQFCMVKLLLRVLQRKSFQPIPVYVQISDILSSKNDKMFSKALASCTFSSLFVYFSILNSFLMLQLPSLIKGKYI